MLASPKPLSVEGVQKLLAPDEALVFFLPGEGATYIFALSSDRLFWKDITVGEKDLGAKIAAFRRGLDVDDLQFSINAGRADLFDLGFAHDLYGLLLGQVDWLIKDKRHLLVVPSGPLTGLPFHLLLTEKPAVARPEPKDLGVYRDAAWLLKRHAVSVLPSVASLQALRVLAGKVEATKPLIGFGDPMFRPDAPPDAGARRGAARYNRPRAATGWPRRRAAMPIIGVPPAPIRRRSASPCRSSPTVPTSSRRWAGRSARRPATFCSVGRPPRRPSRAPASPTIGWSISPPMGWSPATSRAWPSRRWR